DGDVRRYAYLDPTSKIDPNYLTSINPRGTGQLVVDKYPGKTSSAIRNDLKIFRLSEMYFILAEAAVEENKLSDASALIQKVREARNYKGTAVTPTYSSSQVAYADIMKERRVELALEGHRYTDLKRLAVKAGVKMDRNTRDAVLPNETVENLDNGSYKYTFPIPVSEFSGNNNMKQNPGY
ncbi:MAG: RagB/SusD family nutrient uptake outer membrane protein, partial [Algoriella sp.]